MGEAGKRGGAIQAATDCITNERVPLKMNFDSHSLFPTISTQRKSEYYGICQTFHGLRETFELGR